VDHGHEQHYERLPAQEQETVRDFEAVAWGSLDVSEEELQTRWTP
jgi:hypothetical protein